MPYLDLACRAVLAVLFALALAGKARPAGFAAFTASLAAFGWLPRPARVPVAVGVLAVEAACPVLLLVPGTAGLGYLLAGAALTGFTVTLAVARWRGTPVRCRCFGHDAGPAGTGHVIRNLLLLAVTVLGALAMSRPGGPVSAAGVASALAAGAVLGLLATRWDDLAYLASGSTGERLGTGHSGQL